MLRPVPRVPVSAGALITDHDGRLLIVKPTYKSGWTVPGGQLEEDGESPWDGCRREVAEETGLFITSGRLACVDYLRPHGSNPGGVRFLFDCGRLPEGQLAVIRLQHEELSEFRFVLPDQAGELLSGPVGRRVAAALASPGATRYLEGGAPVAGVGPQG